MKYRPEIDGLRAIAVLAVILYHANLPIYGINYFKGGYIGVDIFFVISGYLITSIIINELKSTGNFSFKFFYERRVRRIVPTLIVVILISTPFAWKFMPPLHLVEYAKSILYSLTFSSNLFFYFSSVDYSIDNNFLPFLHTWSLSVEEQFYIIFPLIFYLIYKYFKNKELIIILTIITLSLFYSNYLNEFDQSAAFYFFHTRIWEILIGSFIAYLKIYKKFELDNRFLKEILTLIGLILIIHFIRYANCSSNQSIYYNLLPVIGTCMIISFSYKDILVTKILSSKLLVGIGLISYSLYLWHYPIFVFAKISGITSGNIKYKILLGFFLLFISILSYFLVEKKFRNKNFKFINILKFIIGAILFIVVTSFLIINNNGFVDRFKNLKKISKNYNIDNLYLAKKSWPDNGINNKKFNENKIKIFLIGDSHSVNFQNMFLTNKLLFTKYQFIHTSDYDVPIIKNNSLLKESDIVILSFRWSQNMIDIVKNYTIPYLQKINKKIVIISRTNEYRVLSGIYTLIDKEVLFSKNNINYFGLKKNYYNNRVIHSQSKINQKLKNLSKENNILFLNREDYMCNLEKKECDYLTNDGHKIFYDYGHYTLEGAKYFGEKLYYIDWFKLK